MSFFVWIPVYEGYMVCALQLVAAQVKTLPQSAVTTAAHRLVQSVSHHKPGVEKPSLWDLCSQYPIQHDGLNRLLEDIHLDDRTATRSIEVPPLFATICP
jgi:hypothetical protein